MSGHIRDNVGQMGQKWDSGTVNLSLCRVK